MSSEREGATRACLPRDLRRLEALRAPAKHRGERGEEPRFGRTLNRSTCLATFGNIPLHRLNPVWKPRKALLRSVIRAKTNAPAKNQSDRSYAAGPLRPQKVIKISSRIFVIVHNVSSKSAKFCKLRRDYF